MYLSDDVFNRPTSFSMHSRQRAYNEMLRGARPFSELSAGDKKSFLDEVAAYREHVEGILTTRGAEETVGALRKLVEEYIQCLCSVAFPSRNDIRIHTHEAQETGDDRSIFSEPRGSKTVVGRVMISGSPYIDNHLQGDGGRVSVAEKR